MGIPKFLHWSDSNIILRCPSEFCHKTERSSSWVSAEALKAVKLCHSLSLLCHIWQKNIFCEMCWFFGVAKSIFWMVCILISVVIPLASTKLKGGYTGITLSVCPSVDRIVSALYLQQYSSDPFHICTSYQATSEGVWRVMPVSKFKNLKFWWIFEICIFAFVFFWLGIQYDSMVWVIIRRRGVSSERRSSSCSSLWLIYHSWPSLFRLSWWFNSGNTTGWPYRWFMLSWSALRWGSGLCPVSGLDAFTVPICLPLWMCKGTVSDIWKTVRIPTC